jgi:hypothetical protein
MKSPQTWNTFYWTKVKFGLKPTLRVILFERGPEKEELVMATHKLRSMVASASFGSIHENDFPTGPLKNDFQAIMEKLSTASQPQMLVNIAAMSNEEARSLIEQICRLSDDVWSGLGKT